MHEHHRHGTHTHQHARARSPHAPTPPSVHRYRQPPATACPLCVRQRLPQTALPYNADRWVCLEAAHRLTRCPHCGDLISYHCTRPAAPAVPSPACHPSFFRPLTDALRDHLGGYYVADAADHAGTIAMATGGVPLPPQRQPLRDSAARHILLALYLSHHDLHLRDPQLPAPQAATPAPEAWAETAPEEIAEYLRVTCQFNIALGRQKGTPYPISAYLYPAHPPHHTQLKPPESWASFRDVHLTAPSETTAAQMDPADERAYVRGPEACIREAHRWHSRSPSPPPGRGGPPAPDTHQAKEDQDRPGGPPARPPIRHGSPAGTQAKPRRTTGQTPAAHHQHHPHQRPPLPPYRSTLTRQLGQAPLPAHIHAIQGPPFTQGQGTLHHQHHHRAPAPPDPYRLMPQPPPAPSPPCHSAAGPHRPPTPRGAPHRTASLRVPQAHPPPP